MVRVKYYSNNDSVTVSISYKGKRERFTRKTKAELASIVKARINEINQLEAKSILGLPMAGESVPGAIQKVKISDAIRHHVEQRAMKTDADNLSTDKHYFQRFYEFMFHRGRDYVHEITLADLEALQAAILKEGQKASSVNRLFASIKGFLKRCEDWGYVHVSPGAKLKKLPEQKTETVTWTQGEVDSVVEQLPTWAKNFFYFLYNTGCRPKEASKLKFSDIDFQRKLVTLRTAKGGSVRERKVPVTADLLDILDGIRIDRKVKSIRHNDDPVFLNSHGNPVHPEVFAEQVRIARRKLKLSDKLIPYGLRHTMCSTLADQNVGLPKIQAIAGHVRTETTMRYIHLKEESLRDVIDLVERSRKIKEQRKLS